MIRWLKGGLKLAFALVMVAAIIYPFMQENPIQEAKELELWQVPSKLSALDKADQKKLLAKLTYPDHMPALEPVPDFSKFTDGLKKKKAFFDYLEPFIERENARLAKLRAHILEIQVKLQAKQNLTMEEYAFIYSLFDEFRLDMMDADEAGINELLLRVDVIPASLVLTQAAVESGWGSSRFAIEGYNFFGQWCFKVGCGFVPNKRPPGKYHEVAKFQHTAASVNAYFYNLNTFYMYDDLRILRADLRKKEGNFPPQKLAAGLGRYSERGQLYIDEISSMIAATHKILEDS